MNPFVKLMIKTFTGSHVFLYRISGGRFASKMGPLSILLLTTTGGKTGKQRTKPLPYLREGNSYAVIAANAGMKNHPAWYFNLQHNPKVQIQVHDQLLTAKATTAKGEQRQRLWQQLLVVAPNYADYEKKTTREIPVVILTPDAA
jgi:F420H(2)-dependent quinone reductase